MCSKEGDHITKEQKWGHEMSGALRSWKREEGPSPGHSPLMWDLWSPDSQGAVSHVKLPFVALVTAETGQGTGSSRSQDAARVR